MASKVRLSKCSVGPLEEQAVVEAMRSSYLGIGAVTAAFEQELSAFCGGREVIATATGTAALQLALEACGVGPGDEVLVPTLTFVASYQAISATGAKPVSCDVNPADLTLDVADAARRVTPRTKAILHVHYASGQGDLDGVYQLAAKAGLRVVEDAAHAFGCQYRGARIGATGDVVCFSFDGIKNITSAEGGAIVTGDPAVAAIARDARLLAVEKDTEMRYSGRRSWDFDVHRQGWRYHMSNLNAAIGRVQLSRLMSEFAPRRIALAQRYQEELAGLDGVRLPGLDYGNVVPHIFPIRLPVDRRDAIRSRLDEGGVETGIHYKPNHLLSFYREEGLHFPVAEEAFAGLLSLPLHVDLTDDEQGTVIRELHSALQTVAR